MDRKKDLESEQTSVRIISLDSPHKEHLITNKAPIPEYSYDQRNKISMQRTYSPTKVSELPILAPPMKLSRESQVIFYMILN
jgi:hypothetical protein